MTLEEYYIDRNVRIIKRALELRDKKNSYRIVFEQISDEFDISTHTVKAIIFDKNYAYASEAWEIVNKNKAGKDE